MLPPVQRDDHSLLKATISLPGKRFRSGVARSGGERTKNMDMPGGQALSGQINPRSANDIAAPAPMTKWSSTLTSTSASACLRACVRASSERDGSATPEG